MSNYVTLAFLIFGALLGLTLASRAVDISFYYYGLLLFVCCVSAALYVAKDLALPKHRNNADSSGYNDSVVRAGVIATVFWGVIGFSVGLVIALQLAFPVLNFDLQWLSFGRLRPVHTSAVIFAFGGNALMTTSFYVVQRTCRARLVGHWSPWFVFWGYQLFIVLAATGYVFGITQSKEYA